MRTRANRTMYVTALFSASVTGHLPLYHSTMRSVTVLAPAIVRLQVVSNPYCCKVRDVLAHQFIETVYLQAWCTRSMVKCVI
jgi:hypothetical protein